METLDKLNISLIKSKENIAKAFRGKKSKANLDKRLPIGQYLTDKFPVLDLGIQPEFNPKIWKLEVTGEIEEKKVFTWNDILKMKKTSMTKDFSCVTKWTKYNIQWSGILWKDFIKYIKIKPNVKSVMFYGSDGYSTNVLIEDLNNDTTLLAYELENKSIPREHGAPLRIIISHLYGWKGSKFLNKIEFMKEDKPGFWEVRGYHIRGNVELEERYS